jgi:two-component system, OmpR family, alkaline phosphatase synthesis response regulator PhoP
MPHKILIADDETYIRLLIEQTLEDLEDEGVELLDAGNGEQALSLIQAEAPNLVFLDAMMPLMDGFEVCRLVKHELKMTNVYIVMLTAKGQEMDRIKGEESGVDIYMTKPFDPDELIRISRKVLAL